MSNTHYTASLNLRFSQDDYKLSPYLTNLIESKGGQPSKAACFILAFTERDGCLVPGEALWLQIHEILLQSAHLPSPPPPLVGKELEASDLAKHERLVEQILWADQDEAMLTRLCGRLLGTWGHEYDRVDPNAPAAAMTTQELIEHEFGPAGQALLVYLTEHHYLYPEIAYWLHVWRILPESENGQDQRPQSPVSGLTAGEEDKSALFIDHLLYAQRQGMFDTVATYLHALKPDQWVQLSRNGSFSGKFQDEE